MKRLFLQYRIMKALDKASCEMSLEALGNEINIGDSDKEVRLYNSALKSLYWKKYISLNKKTGSWAIFDVSSFDDFKRSLIPWALGYLVSFATLLSAFCDLYSLIRG